MSVHQEILRAKSVSDGDSYSSANVSATQENAVTKTNNMESKSSSEPVADNRSEDTDQNSAKSIRGHRRQQASVGLGIITSNFDISGDPPSRTKTDAFFSTTQATPRPPPSLSRRSNVTPIRTYPIDDGEDDGNRRLSFASRLRSIVAANKSTAVAPAPSLIPNNCMHSPERSSTDEPTTTTSSIANNRLSVSSNIGSYSDDEIMPLPSPAPGLTSPSSHYSPMTLLHHHHQPQTFPKHRVISPQLSPVTPTDKEDHEALPPSTSPSSSIPVIAMSPYYSPDKTNKLPSLSEEPILGDIDDKSYAQLAALNGDGLLAPMTREYKYPSPAPLQIAEEDIVGKQIGDYRIQKLLGVGAFSKVYLATHTSQGGIEYAIKMINKARIRGDARVRSSIEREVGVLKFIDYPSIVRLESTMETEQHLCIVMEYAKGGELFDFVQQMHRNKQCKVNEGLVRDIFRELVRVVRWMHEHNIVHRDLKLENILIHMDDDGRPRIKVTDFGLARVIDPASPILTTRCGSEEYAAPEIVQSLGYDGRRTDTWALGIILYALLVGYLPFMYNPARGEKVSHLFYRIITAEVKWPAEWNQHPERAVSKEAREVVEKILVRNPEKRILLDDIEKLAWFQQ